MSNVNLDMLDATISAIEKLGAEYGNAIPVFGCAVLGTRYAEDDFEKFVELLPIVAANADLYHWHEGSVGAVRRFCRICYVHPARVEACIGCKLSDIF